MNVVEDLRDAVESQGHTFFTRGDYNLNLIGIRSPESIPHAFDDILYCAYKVDGRWRWHAWPITADPGFRYLSRPINRLGTAILVPGQYRSAYKIGLHRGYPALVQRGPVRVWRDNNKDMVLDWGAGKGIEGYYGINIHRAKPRGATDDPDYYSAGCQVFAVKEEHDALMELARESARRYGPRFTYTLLTG